MAIPKTGKMTTIASIQSHENAYSAILIAPCAMLVATVSVALSRVSIVSTISSRKAFMETKIPEKRIAAITPLPHPSNGMEMSFHARTLIVNPKIVGRVSSFSERFKYEIPNVKSVRIVEDPALSDDGTIVETISTRVDARISTKIGEIVQKLRAEAMKNDI